MGVIGFVAAPIIRSEWVGYAFLAVSVLAMADLSGFFVNFVVKHATRPYDCPKVVDETIWESIVTNVNALTDVGSSTGSLVGFLERILFAAAIWFEAIILIAAWMAVKVATKWNVWAVMLEQARFYQYDPRASPSSAGVHMKRYLGWRLSQGFLIGTILNILIAGVMCGVALAISYLLGIDIDV